MNRKTSKSQLNKLKSGIKNGPEEILNLSSNGLSGSNDETNFSPKLFLTDTHIARIHKAFANGSSKTFSKLNCLRWCSQDFLFSE